MIETLFKQRSTIDRLQSGPSAQHLPVIAETLHQEQYIHSKRSDGMFAWPPGFSDGFASVG